MVGAAGTIGGSAEGKDDRADRAASGAEDAIVGGGHTIGVVDQILRILQGPPTSAEGQHIRSSRRLGLVPTNSDWPV